MGLLKRNMCPILHVPLAFQKFQPLYYKFSREENHLFRNTTFHYYFTFSFLFSYLCSILISILSLLHNQSRLWYDTCNKSITIRTNKSVPSFLFNKMLLSSRPIHSLLSTNQYLYLNLVHTHL